MTSDFSEIKITRDGHMLSIIAYTDDARAWINQEAPRFGKYFETYGDWYLDVSARYNPGQVLDYLLSYLAWSEGGEVGFWGQPRPKKELAIRVAMGILFIFVDSTDARSYIQEEAPQFGDLFPEAGGAVSNYSLFPTSSYEAQHVAMHLLANFKKEPNRMTTQHNPQNKVAAPGQPPSTGCDVGEDVVEGGRRLICFTHKMTLMNPTVTQEVQWRMEHATTSTFDRTPTFDEWAAGKGISAALRESVFHHLMATRSEAEREQPDEWGKALLEVMRDIK